MPKTKRPATRSSSAAASAASQSEDSMMDETTSSSPAAPPPPLTAEEFDRQLEQLLVSLVKSNETFFKSLDSAGRMAALNLPRDVRKLTVDQWEPKFNFRSQDAVGGSKKGLACSASATSSTSSLARAMEEVEQQVSEQVKQAKQDIRASARKKRKAAPSVAPTPAQNSNGSAMLPPGTAGTVRRSTRKRTVRNPEMETPSTSRRTTRGASKSNLLTTPMITPKFDIRTPMNKTVMRVARPDETLVSLSGSPVYAGSTVKKAKRGKKADSTPEMIEIPLGKGRTMMLPIGELTGGLPSTAKKGRGGGGRGKKSSAASSTASSTASGGGLDLDDEDRQKLLSIQSKLGDMLRGVNS